jgi:hypothetical protein
MSNESESKDCKMVDGVDEDGDDIRYVKHIAGCDYNFHCNQCGSHQLSWLMWVNETGETTGVGPDPREAHCDGCGAHGRIADDGWLNRPSSYGYTASE